MTRGTAAHHCSLSCATATVAVVLFLSLSTNLAHAATWFLVGGSDRDAAVIQPIGDHNALICGRRCDVWNAGGRAPTSTDMLGTEIGAIANVRVGDGSVLVVGARA